MIILKESGTTTELIFNSQNRSGDGQASESKPAHTSTMTHEYNFNVSILTGSRISLHNLTFSVFVLCLFYSLKSKNVADVVSN